jgi:predicted Zn-dependent protease
MNAELEAEFERATSLRDSGDLRQARAILEKLAEQYPSAFAVWLVLSGIQMSQEDYEAAEQSSSAAIALRPSSELASLTMFHTLKHRGRMNDAFAEMRRFLALRPESHEYALLRSELEEGEDA